MLYLNRIPVVREPARQLVDERDRAMTATRAPEPERPIPLALTLVQRQREVEERYRAREEVLGLGTIEDEARHRGVGAVERAQLVNEERIREKAHVEHHVGVGRQAVLVPERHEEEAHPRLVAAAEERAELVAELVDGVRGRIDD